MSYHISVNVRCLLWRKKLPRDQWADVLTRRTGIPLPRIRAFLNGTLEDASVDASEVAMLAEVVGLETDPDNLRHPGFALANVDVFAANLQHLLASYGRGGKKVLAAQIGIDPTTLSRWLSGSFVPQTPTLKQLVSHFNLPSDTNLQEEAIFLSVQPLFAAERRQWLHKRIDSMSADELRELFPALRKLFEEA